MVKGKKKLKGTGCVQLLYENETVYYPLSHAQKRIYYTEKIYPNVPCHNLAFTLRFEEELDKELLEQAINEVIRRHGALGLRIAAIDDEHTDEPSQYVAPFEKYSLEGFDFSGKDGEQRLQEWARQTTGKPFHLTSSDSNLFYFAFLKLGRAASGFYMKIHHIIADGWTINMVFEEINRIYEGLASGETVGVNNDNAPSPSYTRYISDEQDYLKSPQAAEDKEYWHSTLVPLPERVNLSFKPVNPGCAGINADTDADADADADAYTAIKGRTMKLAVPHDVSALMNNYSKCHKISTYKLLLAALSIYISRITGLEDFLVGGAGHNRSTDDHRKMAGMFVSTIPFRIKIDTDWKFHRFANHTAKMTDHVVKNRQKYPFDLLAAGLREQTAVDVSHLLDINLIHHGDIQSKEKKFKIQRHFPGYEAAGLTLHINGENKNIDGILELLWDYQVRQFTPGDIRQIHRRLVNILKDTLADPGKKLAEIELLAKKEKEDILFRFNQSEEKDHYPGDKLIHELFEEQAERTPDNIAVFGTAHGTRHTAISCKELNKKSHQLAAVLQSKGVKKEMIVALMAKRSIEFVVGILGILKAGGAFLPVDPEYPQERIDYMLKDSGAILHASGGQGLFLKKPPLDPAKTFYQKFCGGPGGGFSKEPPGRRRQSRSAYIIYTSGSTGKPKGALIEHRGVINLVANHKKIFKEDKNARMSQVSSISFDAMVFEIMPCILGGGTLCIAGNNVRLNPVRLKDWLIKMNITTTFQPTAIAEALLDLEWPGKHETALRKMSTAGDRLTRYPQGQYPFEFYNLYGPTEDTVWTTWAKVVGGTETHRPPSIGKPVKNKRVYILDKGNRLQPVGVPGELCISGRGLARGCLNRPGLTAEKFVGNPYEPGKRMYRTGDLCRWLADGNIDFIGRSDGQVKLRGFRIEIGEVERVLLRQQGVKESVVTIREGVSGKSLCGYVVCGGAVPVSAQGIREGMSKELPDYMVPAYIVKLEALPLTPNGKVDRKSLPDPGGRLTEVAYEAPRDDMEEKLAGIWGEVLGVEKIGINDNFFLIGGDSIKAIQVAARLQAFDCKIDVGDLLKNPTIRKASGKVKKIEEEIDQGEVAGEIHFTPVQQWFIREVKTKKHHWNQSAMLYRKDGFEEEAVKKVFEKLLEHHDALRMVLSEDETRLNNKRVEKGRDFLKVYNLKEEQEIEKKIAEETANLQKSIHLNEGPLLKAALFKTPAGDRLAIAIHHLVVDGVSWRILLEDFGTALQQVLEGKEIVLPKKTHSFKRWSQELKKHSTGKELKKEYQYWKDLCEEAKKTGMEEQTINTGKLKDTKESVFQLGENETGALSEEVNDVYHTEINDILLAALGLAIKDWKGRHRALLNLEGHGREEIAAGIDITRTVGWFTSQYPILLEIGDNLEMHIMQTKEQLRKVPAKGIGYGILRYISDLTEEEKGGLELTPEISFNYLGQFDPGDDAHANGKGFSLSPHGFSASMSEESEQLYGINIDGIMSGGNIIFKFNWNGKKYKDEEIGHFTASFERRLKEIIAHCREKGERIYTPSDFAAGDLDFEEINNIQDILLSRSV